MSNPRFTVSPPETNEAPKFGLLDAVASGAESDGDWLHGIKYQPLACGGGEVLPFGTTGATTGDTGSGEISWQGGSSPFDGETDAKGLDDRPYDNAEFDPFLVITGDSCSTLDKDNPDGDYQDRALRTLALNEGRLVEEEFMFAAARHDAFTQNTTELDDQGLAQVATAVGPGSAVSLKYGLGLLAEYTAAHGVGMPWYHLPRRAIHVAGSDYIVAKWDGAAGIARAFDDGLLIFGAGYDNDDGSGTGAHAGPGSVTPAAHQAWVYATSPVRAWRTAPSVVPDNPSQALTRGGANGVTNSYEYRVERAYLLDWDRCATAAVLVDLNL